MSSPEPLPSHELLIELCQYRMPFGKYQGWPLLRLPEAYLAWFARNGMPSGKLGTLLETALVVRSNGLEPVVEPILQALERQRRAEHASDPDAHPRGSVTARGVKARG